jgi:EmrB/QacA subfamily drug resistance transporter
MKFKLLSYEKIMVVVLFSGAFFASLSQSLLSNAVPVIMHDFVINASVVQLLTSSYTLTMGVVAIATPYLINKYDVRKLFLTCMSIFLVGCVMSYFAPNFIVLVVSRILQALGAGVLFTLTQIVILYIYSKDKYAIILSYLGLIIGFAPSIGPTLAGFIIDFSGWRNIFLLLAIVSVIIILLGLHYVYNVEKETTETTMDVLSVFAIGFSMLLIMIGITNITLNGISLLYSFIPIIVGIILFVFFIHRQYHMEVPLINLKLFNNHLFLVVNIIIYISCFAWMSGYILVPLFLQSTLGVSAVICGLVMLPATIINAVLNPVGGKFYEMFGGKFTSIIGCLLLAVSCIPFIFFNDNVNLIIIVLIYIVRIIGLILLFLPMFAYALKGVDEKEYTQGLSIINSNREIVGSLSTTIILAFVSVLSVKGSVSLQGINLAFFLQMILFFIAVLISIFLLKSEKGHIM